MHRASLSPGRQDGEAIENQAVLSASPAYECPALRLGIFLVSVNLSFLSCNTVMMIPVSLALDVIKA